jgi:hypothetical protein
VAKMDDDTLRTLVKARRDSSSNKLDSEYSKNRREALAFYRGDKDPAYGPDEPGMSSVISRDTMEAVESMLPGLLKPFVSGDEVVRFEPTGPEDEETSKQASEYINYLFTRRNDGFSIITTSMKDGMLFRLGVGKVVREEIEDYKTENYQGLSDIELQAIQSDKSVEVIGEPEQEIDPETGQPSYSIQCQRQQTKAKVAVYCVAPDEFLFERHLASLEYATFLGQETRCSVSDLIAMGLDPVKCKKLTADSDMTYNTERTQRFAGENPTPLSADTDIARLVRVTECYIKCDYEGNGKLVWRRIFLGGGDDAILSNDPVDCHPYVAWTPIPIPHKLVGLSIHDLTRDIQLIKTALAREVQNNLYLSNRPMREVVDGQVNIDDVLTPRVGGLVRVKTPGMMREVATPFTAASSMGIVEYYDQVREQRTGSTRYNQGLDADSLNKTATGINSIMAAAGMRIEMIARQYAEQFLKPLFLKMLELVCKHPDQKEVIRLRNQWVEMDPREWNTEYDMTVTVGLGSGSREKMVMEIQQLLQIDAQILQLQGGPSGPLLDYEKIYGKLKRLVEAMGLKGVDNFYNDPATAEQPEQAPAAPDPEAVKAQAQQIQAQMDAQLKQYEIDADRQTKIEAAQITAQGKIEAERVKGEYELRRHMLSLPAEMAAALDGPGADDTMAHEGAEMPAYEAAEPMIEPGEPYGQ